MVEILAAFISIPPENKTGILEHVGCLHHLQTSLLILRLYACAHTEMYRYQSERGRSGIEPDQRSSAALVNLITILLQHLLSFLDSLVDPVNFSLISFHQVFHYL